MARSPIKQAYFIKIDSLCVNPKIGDLLGQYLFDQLDPRLKETFENHMDGCTACFTAVKNWENLRPRKGD